MEMKFQLIRKDNDFTKWGNENVSKNKIIVQIGIIVIVLLSCFVA